MKVIEAGHRYLLAQLDEPALAASSGQSLRFVKRVGEKYPGNASPPYEGVTSQEVIRALIDRTKYVDNQIRDTNNQSVLEHLRGALRHLEIRAAERRNDLVAALVIETLPKPEHVVTCKKCGHILCKEH